MSKKYLIVCVLGIVALRWIFPDSDPAWWLSIEDLHDEAWWAENARRKIIFNEWMWDEYAGALASGPLTVVWHWITFKLFGISFFSLRLVSLIPATLILLLMWFRNPLLEKTNKVGLILLASSPIFFALNRVGYLETILVFILLLCITLIRLNTFWSSVFTGVLFCFGLLFKGSFIFLLIPLILWLWMDSTNRKHLLISTSVLAILSLLSFLIFFIPNQELFLPYIVAFSQDYIPATDLYDPRGWIARLAWLPEKSWLSSPLACWLVIYLLIKISKGYFPAFKSSVWGLFMLILAAALFTDFSDRRLSILIVLVPFLITEDFNVKSTSIHNIIWGFTLSLSLLPWVIGGIRAGSYNELLFQSSKFGLLFLGIILIGYFLLKALKINQPSLYILRIGIASWVFTLMHYSAINLVELIGVDYWLLMGIQSFLSLLILNAEFEIFQIGPTKAILGKSFIAAQMLLILSVILFPTFTLRTAAEQISKNIQTGEHVDGPNNAIELCFLSRGKTYMYTQENSKKDRLFVGYYSRTDQDNVTIAENNLNLTSKNGNRFLLFPFGNKYKAEAYLVYSVPFFENTLK